jgi:hypothetical protein
MGDGGAVGVPIEWVASWLVVGRRTHSRQARQQPARPHPRPQQCSLFLGTPIHTPPQLSPPTSSGQPLRRCWMVPSASSAYVALPVRCDRLQNSTWWVPNSDSVDALHSGSEGSVGCGGVGGGEGGGMWGR